MLVYDYSHTGRSNGGKNVADDGNSWRRIHGVRFSRMTPDKRRTIILETILTAILAAERGFKPGTKEYFKVQFAVEEEIKNIQSTIRTIVDDRLVSLAIGSQTASSQTLSGYLAAFDKLDADPDWFDRDFPELAVDLRQIISTTPQSPLEQVIGEIVN